MVKLASAMFINLKNLPKLERAVLCVFKIIVKYYSPNKISTILFPASPFPYKPVGYGLS